MTISPRRHPAPSRCRWWPWPALIALAAGVYVDTLSYGFVWDDVHLILHDHVIKSPKYLDVVFTSDFFGHQEDDLVYGYFRPLVTLSYALDYALFQSEPFGYHLTNILWHTGATLMSFALLLRWGLSRVGAFAGAALFAVHPMHVENVAWISGRTDVLAYVFALGALLLQPSAPGGRMRRGLALLFFAAALLSKEMAVLVIPWLVVHRVIELRQGPGRIAREILPFLGVLGLYLVWRFAVVNVDIPVQPTDVGLLDTIATAPWTVVRYVAWLLLPLDQSAYVQNPYVYGPGDVRLFVGIAGAVAGTLAFRGLLKTHRTAALMVALLGVSFLPVLNFVSVSAPRDMGHAMAERFLYFPSLPFAGLFGAASAALFDRARPGRRAAVAALVGAVIIALSIATMVRNPTWRDNETFYTETLKSAPSALLWCNLANHHIHEGDFEAAEDALDQAKRYFADDYHYMAVAASWYVAQGRHREALALQQKVAAKVQRGRAVAYNNLAFIYRSLGELDKAEAYLQEVIDNDRAYGDVYFNLGEVHRARGDLDRAEALLREALARRPDNRQYTGALGGLLAQQGRYKEAADLYARQIVFHPTDPGLWNNIGVIYRKLGRDAEAVGAFESALAHGPDHAKARLNLAAAYLNAGLRERARPHLERLVRFGEGTPEGRQAAALLEKISSKSRTEASGRATVPNRP